MRLPLILLTALSLVALSSLAQDKKNDATGTWTWAFPGRDGNTFNQTAKLKQDGEKLAGSVTGRQGAESPIENGKVVGNELSFTLTRDFGGTKIVSKYSGKLDGDTLKGKIATERDGETNERDWEARREKAAGAAATPAAPAAMAKAAGTWQFKRARDDGSEMKSVLKLKQDGEKITGTNTWNDGPEVPIEEASLRGDTIAFTITRERDGNKMTARYNGKLEENKITGTVSANVGGEDRTFDITFDRVKE